MRKMPNASTDSRLRPSLQRSRTANGAEKAIASLSSTTEETLQRSRTANGAEKKSAILGADGRPVLQRSRTANGAENLCAAGRLSPRPRSFNGAAPRTVRKIDRGHQRRSGRIPASTEPHRERCGKGNRLGVDPHSGGGFNGAAPRTVRKNRQKIPITFCCSELQRSRTANGAEK